MSRVRRWCFTINNPSDDAVLALRTLGAAPTVKYLVFGREVGASGTPHLQGFVIFKDCPRLSACKTRIGGVGHCEAARGTNTQASEYCKKDGDYEEFGVLDNESGRRSDWDNYRAFVEDLGRMPTVNEIILHNPSLYARYKKACLEIANAYLPEISFTGDDSPRFGWQTQVAGLINSESHLNRNIYFVVDTEGNAGKSWMCRWALTHHRDKVQILKVGKRDDVAHAVDETKSVFLCDIPRGQMMYLQYSVLEMLKDQIVFSPKYESRSKYLRVVPLVIVFCNEHPDMNAMTSDRYNIINVN